MTIWEFISFTEIVSIKNYQYWIIKCDLPKFHHCMSTLILSNLRSFNVRRGFLEILFVPKFQEKKYFLQKCDDHCMIPET